MKLRTALITEDIMLIIPAILLVISFYADDKFVPILSISGVVIAMTGLVIFWIFWQCPHCDRKLPTSGCLGMKHCPYCGNDLDI